MILKIKDKKHSTFIFEDVERFTYQAQDLIILFNDYTYSSIPSDDILTIEEFTDEEDIFL